MVKLFFNYDNKTREGYVTANPNLYECPAGEAEEICGEYILEKVPNIIAFVENIYESLKPGGVATFTAHYFDNWQSFEDPRNIRQLSQGSLNFADKNWREQKGCPDLCKADFAVGCNFAIDGIVNQRSEAAKEFWMNRYKNVVQSVQFTLTKR